MSTTIVGLADRLFVMLDHDDGVAQIAQAASASSSRSLSRWCRPMRRLIQHVEHAGQARADLDGQPNALALAAGQGARVRRRSGNPGRHSRNPNRSLISFRIRSPMSLSLLPTRHPVWKPVAGIGDTQFGTWLDVREAQSRGPTLTANASGFSRSPLQAAQAVCAWIAAQFLAHPGAIGLAQRRSMFGNDAFERLGHWSLYRSRLRRSCAPAPSPEPYSIASCAAFSRSGSRFHVDAIMRG